jgi:ubiquinone/menaquinone biosynthesis C-methylase UbiE
MAGYGSGSFDYVVSAFALHNMTGAARKKIYPELYRVLKIAWCFINNDKIAVDSKAEHDWEYDREIGLIDLFRTGGRQGPG